MNRRDEYWALVQAAAQEPPELEGAVARAVARGKRRRWRRPLGILGSLAGVCAAFVLTVNASPAFALGCAQIPVLRDLAAAVAFSPSLKAAVEYDYVQYIGQTQSAAGISMTVEYAIVSDAQAYFFFRLEGDYNPVWRLLDEGGTPLDGYSTAQASAAAVDTAQLRHVEFQFFRQSIPARLTAQCTLRPADPTRQEDAPVTLTFSLRLDPEKIAGPKVVAVGEWLEADGQRLLLDRLEVYPTHTAVYFQEDPDNTCWLKGAGLCFTAGDGTQYRESAGSLSASGDPESQSMLTYYRQSLYFLEGQTLILSIQGLEWLEKGREWADIDLVRAAATGLPEGVRLAEIRREPDRAVLAVESRDRPQPLSGVYRDPDGEIHSFDGMTAEGWSWQEARGEPYCTEYHIKDCAWDAIQVQLACTAVGRYEDLSVPLRLP